MLIDVIKSVTGRRVMADGNIDHSVQLSKFFMDKFVDELNKFTGKDQFQNNDLMYEINWMYWGFTWVIRHRAFRDDTNSKDLEEELYNQLVNHKIK
jgi:hypothetical protein